MLKNILAMDSAELAEKSRDIPISEAALYALLGFLIVVVGIAFLIFIVWLVGKIMSKSSVKATKEPVKSEKPVHVPVLKGQTAQDINAVDDETVAVIMAALMAYYQKSNPKCEFTVKRIKRV